MGDPFPGDDQNISRFRHFLLIQTEKLSQQSLDPVSFDRFSDLFTDRQAEPSNSQRIVTHKDDEVLRVVSCSSTGLAEILFLPELLLFLKGF